MNRPRRFHNKSRFGCNDCKRRKVKCDEKQPVCSACEKFRVECSYDAVARPTAAATIGPASSKVDLAAAKPGPKFDALDLYLMHYFSITTYKCLIPGDRQSQVWQHHVTKLAVSNPLLMQGILAVTALHHVHNNQIDRSIYIDRALYHHGASLPNFQEMVGSASAATTETIIIYAILLSVWIYASFQVVAEPAPLGSILDTVEIVRSSRTVFNLCQQVLLNTPIVAFLTPSPREPLPINRMRNAAVEALDRLRTQVENVADHAAIDRLQRLLEQYLAGTDNRRAAANWMASVDDGYWGRLRDCHPHAVLVFAYSCLLSGASEHECWWMVGWSDLVLQACSGVLSQINRQLIRWVDHEKLIRSCSVELEILARRRDEHAVVL